MLSIATTVAQSKKQEKAETGKDNSYAPYSAAESAYTRQEAKTSRKARRKGQASFTKAFTKSLDQKIVEFEERMKRNAKEDRKEARIMKKPQYSDPAYFGHKRKPKKRKSGKRKLCKECGIVH